MERLNRPPAKPVNGAVGRRQDGACSACGCPGPAGRGTGMSGLPICTCGHLVVCHDGHGVLLSPVPEPTTFPRQKYPQQ